MDILNLLKGHEGLVLKVVLIVCAAWIICSWIDAQTNRYSAIDDKDIILDKRTGAVYDPQHRELVEFGEDKREKKNSTKDSRPTGGYEEDIDIDALPIIEDIDLDALPIIEG